MKLTPKIKVLSLTGEFVGHTLTMNISPPMSVWEDFASGEITRVMGALATMTRGSNLTDERDEVIDLTTVQGWRQVSKEYISEVAERVKEALEDPKGPPTASTTPSSPGPAPVPISTT